jgi:hypothetical protein
VRCVGHELDNLENPKALNRITPVLLLAASTGLLYHTGESWLKALMNVLVGGHSHVLYTGTSAAAENLGLDDLIVSFIYFLKYGIPCERRLHQEKDSRQGEDGWSQHAEFKTLC